MTHLPFRAHPSVSQPLRADKAAPVAVPPAAGAAQVTEVVPCASVAGRSGGDKLQAGCAAPAVKEPREAQGLKPIGPTLLKIVERVKL